MRLAVGARGPLTGREKDALERFAAVDPASPALLDLAGAALEEGDPERALATAGAVLAAHPYHLEAALLTARSQLALGRPEPARETLAAIDADHLARLLSEMGRLYESIAENDAAEKLAAAASALWGQAAPDNAPTAPQAEEFEAAVESPEQTQPPAPPDDAAKARVVERLTKLKEAARKRRIELQNAAQE
jgi:hypothetical protein